jgi:hypothetical protein
MGFNIAGVVINKNYEGKLEELQDDLGLKFTREKEITYEEASANWKDDALVDVYFSKNGTLLFMAMDMCIEGYSIAQQHVLTFAYSETSMAFTLNYYEDDDLKRSIMEVNNEKTDDEGDPLPEEAQTSDTADLIVKKISSVLGESFWDIDVAAPAIRCRF